MDLSTRPAELHDVPAESVPLTVYGVALALAITVCWILPLRNPLSRDETGTYWIVKDGVIDVISRSYYWTNWSPYYLIEWMAVHAGGTSALVMRLPSIAAMCLAAFLLFRIGTRLWDREAGLLAVLVFAVMPAIGFAAGDARPYAFTLVALCAYTWVVLRWIDTGAIEYAILASVFAALTAYGHVLLGVGLVIPAFYAGWSRPKASHLALAAVLTAVLLVPLVIQLRAYMSMGTSHFAGFFPVLDDLWAAIVSAQFLAAIGLGVLFAFLLIPALRMNWAMPRPATAFLVAWGIFTPVLLFALARARLAQLFLDRYLLSTAIPQALLYGGLIRAVAPSKARALVLSTMVVLSAGAFFFSAKSFHGEGWKDAMAAVRAQVGDSNIPLVMSSPFVEARTTEMLTDSRLKDVLFAPVFIYPSGARLIRLPYGYDEPSLKKIADTDLSHENTFVLLTPNTAIPEWLEQRFAERHGKSTLVGVYRGLQVYRFRMDD
ncbi:MAG TPA: glycosyltransferase family 39 protein [Vicinamibacterales bacterium]